MKRSSLESGFAAHLLGLPCGHDGARSKIFVAVSLANPLLGMSS